MKTVFSLHPVLQITEMLMFQNNHCRHTQIAHFSRSVGFLALSPRRRATPAVDGGATVMWAHCQCSLASLHCDRCYLRWIPGVSHVGDGPDSTQGLDWTTSIHQERSWELGNKKKKHYIDQNECRKTKDSEFFMY